MKTPIVNANSKLLVPGLPGHKAPVKGATQGSEKRKTDTKEVSWIIDVLPGTTGSTVMLLNISVCRDPAGHVNPCFRCVVQQMTIAERIGEIDLSSKKAAVKGAASLQTDSFAVLLVQGLESNDAHILNVSSFQGPFF